MAQPGPQYRFSTVELISEDDGSVTTSSIRADHYYRREDDVAIMGDGDQRVITRNHSLVLPTTDEDFYQQAEIWQSQRVKCTAVMTGIDGVIYWGEPSVPIVRIAQQTVGDRHLRTVNLFTAKRNAAIVSIGSTNLIDDWEDGNSNNVPDSWTESEANLTSTPSFDDTTGQLSIAFSSVNPAASYQLHKTVSFDDVGAEVILLVPVDDVYGGTVLFNGVSISALNGASSIIDTVNADITESGVAICRMVVPATTASLRAFVVDLQPVTSGSGTQKIRKPVLGVYT